MKQKDLIKEIMIDFYSYDFDKVKARDFVLPVDTGKIISLIGVRRSGKTYIVLDTIKKLLKSGIPKEKIIYLNFEDERLDLETSDLDLILQVARELSPNQEIKDYYFFFDEIQNIENWEKFVRRMYDSISRNITITGSNSKLLSKEIASSLRGRTMNYDVYPLSFKEILSFQNIKLSKSISAKNKARLNTLLAEYLRWGGFPEIIELDNSYADKILQDYYQVMIYRDLVERYKIQSSHILKYYFDRIINNLTTTSSINKIYKELKSRGFKTSKDSLYDYIAWAEAIYFMIKIPKFSFSLLQTERVEKKYYLIDNGLLNALTFSYSKNYGALLENLIAVELKRRYGDEIFYFKDKSECDFLVFEKKQLKEVIQVSYDISNADTRKREIKGLLEACKYFKHTTGIIITYDHEESIIEDGVNISCIPLLKYLLAD